MRTRLCFSSTVRRLGVGVALVALGLTGVAAQDATERPFGTLREQAALQQQWLRKRVDTFLPILMRKYGIDMWIVPMREYNEDPVFSALVAPETFAARVGRSTSFSTRAHRPLRRRQRCALNGSRSVGRRRVVCTTRAGRRRAPRRTSGADSRRSSGETNNGSR